MIVLVAYASSHGSTKGIAERIANQLRLRRLNAVARAVTPDMRVAGYEAVVVGSAVHGGHWLPDAARFLVQNTENLRRRPTWLFSVSTLGDEESMFPPAVANRLRALRKETAEISAFRDAVQPREHRNFAGAIAVTDWPASGRAFFRIMGGRYGDHRNWRAVDAWADCIAAELEARKHSKDAASTLRSASEAVGRSQ